MVRWVLVVGLLSLAVGRYWSEKARGVPYKEGDVVRITAVVRQEPRRFAGKQYLMLGQIEIQLPESAELAYGDKIQVVGRLEKRVIEKEIEGLRLIYQSFSRLPGRGTARRQLEENLGKWLPGDAGSLASGILLGGTSGLTVQVKEAFRRSGLLHIVAASGYNVSLVTGWTMAVGWWLLGRRLAILFAIFTTVVYMFLAGLAPSVVRAGIMAIAALGGLILGRESDSRWLLILTAAGMLAVNPLLAWDIGWQLSLAATAGLVWLRPRGDWGTTLAAQTMTLPLLLYHFGNLSIMAPLTNAALLWTVPLIMQVTAIASLVGWALGAPVGQLIAYLAWPLLKLLTNTVTWVASWPVSFWEVGRVSWWWVIGYYIVIAILVSRRRFLYPDAVDKYH